MTSEIVQSPDKNPLINPPQPKSRASGYENIAKTLGAIAQRSQAKAEDYATEASKTNLLETNSMLKDVEMNSKIEMARSPGHSEAIAKNAEQTADKIKSNAKLNRADKVNLDNSAKDTVRDLTYTATLKSISMANETAKFNTLATFNNTLQRIKDDIYLNPEAVDSIIEAQYSSIAGQVKSGILTAVEGANLHKQLQTQVGLAHEVLVGMRDGLLSASDVNALDATNPVQAPLSNGHLPINHGTATQADHYYGHLTTADLKVKYANGENVQSKDLMAIKKISDLDHLYNYAHGTKKAEGDLRSLKEWPALKNKLEVLKKTKPLSTIEQGYKDRLTKFFGGIDDPLFYENYINASPSGAKAANDFNMRNTIINSAALFGTPEQIAHQKQIQHTDSINQFISERNAAGIGAMVPDHLRQPIPPQIIGPIKNAFEKDGDIHSAISNIQMLNKNNRVYAMNAFPNNPRKKLTVLEVGNLADKADSGFLIDLMQSQQVDNLGEKPGKKDSQEKFLQLDKSKDGYSDAKLAARIRPELTSIYNYLTRQQGGNDISSAKTDQALRYIKDQASKHNDFEFKHLDDYIDKFKNNMNKAYDVKSGFNFVVSGSDVPLDEDEIQVLASHAINDTRNKLLEYMTPTQVDEFFVNSPPILVSSPGGRIEVTTADNRLIPDKNGNPAFSELYTESVFRKAEHDTNAETESSHMINPLFGKPERVKNNPLLSYLRGHKDIVRPLIEGNINLDDRPKVFNDKGEYEIIKPIIREIDGKNVLIPTIINNKEVSAKKAIEHFKTTGEHLGIFKNKEDADKYNKKLRMRMGLPEEGTK